MSLVTVERFFTELFKSRHVGKTVQVVWHSGEPLTLPVSYYDDAIERILALRERLCGDSVAVRFSIQTNGVLIDESWCDLFQRHKDRLTIGISCDGPAELHDHYRRNWSGKATHAKVVRGMEQLEAAGIAYNVIAVVTRQTLSQPDEFFSFFHERRSKMLEFHFNVLADAYSDNADLCYSSADSGVYYNFFRKLLALTRQTSGSGPAFPIRNFTQTFARITQAGSGEAPDYVEEASAPLATINLDATGNVTTFYAGLGQDTLPDLYEPGKGMSLGNIFEMSLDEMAASPKLKLMRRDFDASRATCRAGCEYFDVCTGGFEITKRQVLGTFSAMETTECLIHVKAMVDAVLDDIDDHLAVQQRNLAVC